MQIKTSIHRLALFYPKTFRYREMSFRDLSNHVRTPSYNLTKFGVGFGLDLP